MSVNILSIKDSLQNLIDKNNTTTSSYDISTSLKGRVQVISGGSASRVPVLNINYPAIFVELQGVNDAHMELGMTARRDTEAQFRIVAVTDYGVATEKYEETDNEMIQLTQNLTKLFRNYVTLSNTVDSCLINGIDFITDEGTYNARSAMSLSVKKRG
jgi:hypothetical protein